MLASINVRAKRNSFVTDILQPGQAKYLVTTAISKYGSIPAHESVKTPYFSDCVYSRSQIEMVGISQHHRYSDILKLLGSNCFNSSLTTYWQKHWGRNYPVGCNQLSSTGIATRTGLYKMKAICVFYNPIPLIPF